MRPRPVVPVELGKFRRVPLLSAGELAFFAPLVRVVPRSHRVFCKIRVRDLVAPVDGLGWSKRSSLNQKHVDFVLFDRLTARVDVVIELDDKSHGEIRRIRRDNLLSAVLLAAGLKLMRVQVQQAYDVEELRAAIMVALQS